VIPYFCLKKLGEKRKAKQVSTEMPAPVFKLRHRNLFLPA
jgi:hypothetical protein